MRSQVLFEYSEKLTRALGWVEAPVHEALAVKSERPPLRELVGPKESDARILCCVMKQKLCWYT